jgi:hypothetical protein
MAAVLITAIPLLGLSMLEIAKQVTPIAQAQTGLPAHPDWVDRTVGSHANVSLVGDTGKTVAPLRETAFWNSSITRLYYTCGAAFGSDFGEQQLGAGTSIPARYVVVPESMTVPGRVLARDRPGKLVLVAPTGGTLRVSSTLRCKRGSSGDALAPAQPEQREQERREEDLDTDDDERGGQDRDPLVGEAAKAAGDPVRNDHSTNCQTGRHESEAEQ